MLCPWNRGTVEGHHGQAVEPTKSARQDGAARRGRLRSRAWFVERLRLGSGMPAPSGQIPPPWARWENEAPAARAACGLSQAIGLVGLTVRLLLGEPALGAPGIVLGFLQDVRDERIAKFLLRELIL